MNGYRRGYGMYPQQQGSGFYNPMMKTPDIAGGIRAFMEQLAGMKQMGAQREQQQWRRSITEREIALKEEQAQKQPGQTRWNFQKQYAQYMNTTGQWTEDQSSAYLATNKVPEKLVEIPVETKSEIEQFFGLKDFSQISPSEQEGYIKTYALQKHKTPPGQPVPRESIKLKQDRDKLVSPLVERYQGIIKKIDAALYELGDREDVKYPQYQRQLHNAKKAQNILLYAQSIVDGGNELPPELRKLVRQISYKTREVQTGKFFALDKFGYALGETRIDKNGREIMYIGNDGWMDKL